jgi:hypothetical protein
MTSAEIREGLSVCLHVAEFEKRVGNFAGWDYDPPRGFCVTQYSLAANQRKNKADCNKARDAEAESLKDNRYASQSIHREYEDCVNGRFSREWAVGISYHPADDALGVATDYSVTEVTLPK